MNISQIKAQTAACILGGLLIFTTGCSAPQSTSPANLPDAAPTNAPLPATLNNAPPTVAVQPITAATSAAMSPVAPVTSAPTATSTPEIPPMPIPTPPAQPYVYHTVSAGETMGYISLIYDTPIEQLVAMNDLSGPDAVIQVDQKLRVPMQSSQTASGTPLIPDSEVVYGPGFVDFDISAFVDEQGGYLASYQQYVNNQPLTGAQLVERVSRKFSVGPRLLLALLEYYGGWVTQPTLTEEQINAPFGPHNPRGADLYHALTFTANRVNAGYYGYKRDGFWIFRLPDGNQAISATGTNAGTIGVQNILALYSDWDTWQMELEGKGLMATYRTLFGDPFKNAVHPVVPINLTQPPLALPWRKGVGFYFTSGPHGGFVDGSAWAAIDFGPPDVLGNCFYSDEPTTAVADGVVISAQQGEVIVDLDGDGQIQTGWVLLYLHVVLDADTPLQNGQAVKTGDVIGYASCEGGLSNSSHLHFARRYNGEWMAAGGPVPLDLGGWVVQPNQVPYEGTIANGGKVREACQCWDETLNLIINPADE